MHIHPTVFRKEDCGIQNYEVIFMKTMIRVLSAVIAVLLLSGCNAAPAANQQNVVTTPKGGYYVYTDELDMFRGGKLDELMDLCEERFIGEADRNAMEDAAAAAIVESLGDVWSYYIPAEHMGSFNETMSNSYVGIGISIKVREDKAGFDISGVDKGGPAYEAGILPGDILVAANGQKLGEGSTDTAAEIIRGEEGTTVDVTVLRDGEEITYTVERRTILVAVAEATMLDGNIGLISIENFDARCAEETIACIESLIEQGATSLIFDVRYNPGGYADQMVALLDYLLPAGEIFITEDYMGNREVDVSDASCLEMPMVVLVNGDSFSAAEFFACALRDFQWATIVGEQTVGKGYYQNVFSFTDGSALNLSTGKYYTSSGINLAEAGGLTPDKVVEVDDETYVKIYYDLVEPKDDPQIQAAIKVLKAQ